METSNRNLKNFNFNQNKDKELILGVPIGLVCFTENVSTTVCGLCTSQREFNKLLHLIGHIAREHTGKIRSKEDEKVRSKDLQQMEASIFNLGATLNSNSFKRSQKELANGTNMSKVKMEEENLNTVDITSNEFYCHLCERNFLSKKEVVQHICSNVSPTLTNTVPTQNQPINADESNFITSLSFISDANNYVPIDDEKRWTHERKKLLIAIRLRHEEDFIAKNEKRTIIWKTILREIKEVDNTFPFTRYEICRCFLNIMGTYKRIKKRNNTSGEIASTWEYFKDIDRVVGNRSSNILPPDMTEYCLEQESCVLRDSPVTTELIDVTPVTSMKRKKNEVLDFLENESEKNNKMLNKILKIESEKLEIEKEKFSELKRLRNIFEKIAE